MLRRRLLVVLATVVALGASACAKSATTTHGSNTTNLSPFQLVSQAASKTEAEKTAHMSMTMNINGGGQSVDVTGNGAVDIENQAAQLTFDMSGIPGANGTASFDMVLKDGVMYMKVPQSLAGQTPGGKSWIKIDISAFEKQAGLGVGGLSGGSMAAFDPAQTLAYLKGVSQSVTHVGSDTVDGASTEQFHIVIDMKKALDQVSGSMKCDLSSIESSLGDMTIPADVWIDDQGRLRRMTMDLTMNVPGSQQSVGMTMQMDLTDFGTPVNVTAPPADQVYDVTPSIPTQIPGCKTTNA